MDFRGVSPVYHLQPPVQNVWSTINHNTANVRAMYAFQAPPVADTLTQLRIFSEGISGSVTGICSVDIFAFDTSTYTPTGSSLATTTGTPVSSNWFNTDTFSLATTANAWYCAVTRNVSSDPVNNRFTLPIGYTAAIYNPTTGVSRTSTDAGATWSPMQTTDRDRPFVHTSVCPLFSTTGYYSAPSFRLQAAGSSGDIYADGSTYRGRYGVEYEFPEPVVLQALSYMRCNPANSPNFNLKAEVWSNNVLIATSTNVLLGNANGPWLFDDVLLNAGQLYQIVLLPELDTAGSPSVRYLPAPVQAPAYTTGWKVGPYRRGVAATNFANPPSFSTTDFYAQSLLLGFAPGSGGSGGVSAARVVNGL